MIRFDYDQQDWGSRTEYADYTKLPFRPDKVVIHYGGWTTQIVGVEDEKDRLRRWQRYHIDGRGWTDIAYNFAVGDSGSVYRLRGYNRSGAQSGDYEPDGIPENHEAIGVVWIGGAPKPENGGPYSPSEQAYAAMGRLVREADMPTVLGHRQIKPGSTSCPGSYWQDWIDNQRWKIEPPPEEEDMPEQQWHQLIDALFAGRPDEYQGNPDYWKNLSPDNPEWVDFWNAFVRVIGE